MWGLSAKDFVIAYGWTWKITCKILAWSQPAQMPIKIISIFLKLKYSLQGIDQSELIYEKKKNQAGDK